jgi:hypothetical protein
MYETLKSIYLYFSKKTSRQILMSLVKKLNEIDFEFNRQDLTLLKIRHRQKDY